MNERNQFEKLHRLETAIAAMRRAIINARERLGSGLQMTRTQLEVLRLLADKPGQTISELARQLFLTQSAVTQTVDTLVRRDLIERQPDEHDRRSIRLRLSSDGHDIIKHVNTLRRRHLEELFSRLSPAESEALIAATEKVAAFVEVAQETNTKA